MLDSEKELWHKTPLCTVGKNDDSLVTQYSMKYLEPVDLIKFDFLGLKTLTVIDDALKLIKKRYGKSIDFLSIDVDDKNVYKTIQSGDTLGIFQIESSMFQGLNRRVKPNCFEDIVAIIALGRPGPMESGMVDDFIDRKHGVKSISYMFPELEAILKPTYGTIVYQEQVMQIVQTIGGFSLGGADLVRRAMGKKIKEEMERLKDEFTIGAQKKGFDKVKAGELFELIVKFAGYGFNKSHSAAYAMITFQTAYLKTYYKEEFMAALLTSESSKIESVAKYIAEVEKIGIELLPPHVNRSDMDFGVGDFEEIDENGRVKKVKKIVFGLSAIKGVGEEPIRNIISERFRGEFKDLVDFVSRIDSAKVNKRVLEPLVKSGALDDLGYSRACMIENLDVICESARSKDKLKEQMSAGLFGDLEEENSQRANLNLANKPELELEELLNYEYECLGFYVSGHPLEQYIKQINAISGMVRSIDLADLSDGSLCLIVGRVLEIHRKMSKSGKPYAYVDILDLSGKVELMFFERHLNDLDAFNLQEPIAIKCKIEQGDEGYQARVMEIMELSKAKKQKIEAVFEEALSSPIALCLNLTESLNSQEIFKALAQKAAQHAGGRQLKIILQDEQSAFCFSSELFVSSAIKEEFLQYKWVDL